jgi:glycosyltransferase involved in cell wall biosynthesis
MLTSTAICILAHNEEAHIKETIISLCQSVGADGVPIIVYANGCTDQTSAIVNDVSKSRPNVSLRQLSIASKTNAWNTAFFENAADFLVFSDGDIETDRNTIRRLTDILSANEQAVIASCRFACKKGKPSIARRIVSFLQTPLVFDYLCGGLYAVHRQRLKTIFDRHQLQGIPIGITGEDDFLDMMLGRQQLLFIDLPFYYVPPTVSEYCSLLARFKWQSRQLDAYYQNYYHRDKAGKNSFARRALMKLQTRPTDINWFPGLPAMLARLVFFAFLYPLISKRFAELGTIRKDGSHVLSDASRSQSAKI